jgi:hypothetical protein
MTDKSNFTADEWKTLLESVMMAGIAVTAADPSGLWGLLKESFASSSELMKAKLDPGANPLIKAVVDDFGTAQGRSTARDGLTEKLKGIKPAEISAKCIETLRQAARWSTPRHRAMPPPSRVGCARSVSTLLRQPPKVGFLVSAARR